MSRDRELISSGDGAQPSSVVADSRQRRLLSILLDTTGPVGIDELAARLAATEAETAARGRLRVDLYHRCLPKLEEIGWIEWEPSAGVTAESLPFGDGPLPALDALDDRFWTAVGVLLGCPRRRELLSTIAEQRHQLTVEELTAALADRTTWSAYEEEATIHVILRHIDLPKLADVGLIEYDPDEGWMTRTRLLILLAERIDLDRSLIETRWS